MITTLTFITVTGSLVLFKLALMALAVILLTKTLFTGSRQLGLVSTKAKHPPYSMARYARRV